MKKLSYAQLADKITDALMVNGQGEKAVRLQLRGPLEKDLGGRYRDSVFAAVLAVLMEKP